MIRKWRFFLCSLVGVAGFEPTTSASRRQRSTKLSYTPILLFSSLLPTLAWKQRIGIILKNAFLASAWRHGVASVLALYRQARQLGHAVAITAGRQELKLLECLGRHLFGAGAGVFQRAGFMHDGEHFVEVVEPALANGLADGFGLFRGAGHHGLDQRQGRLAFGQVVAHVLAHGFGVRSEERRVGKECRRRWSPSH